jgi:signal transduction histidine kinase
MSIVKEIVELHNGYIDIVSQYGEGTTVTLWLPVTTTE